LILLTVSCNCSDSVNSNKDPVCETELHFTEKYQIVSKSFEIQFTPPLVFKPKQFPTISIKKTKSDGSPCICQLKRGI